VNEQPTSLCVLAQEAGAAAAFAPLLRRWIAARRPASLIFGPAAVAAYERAGWQLPSGVPALIGAAASDPVEVEAFLDKQEAPDVVLASATNSKAETAAVMWARARKIASVQLVDTWERIGARFSPSLPETMPDRIAVIDDEAAHDAEQDGLPSASLATVGQPAWEVVTPLPPAPLARVVFVGQPIAQTWGDRLGCTERDAWLFCREGFRLAGGGMHDLAYLQHPAEKEMDRALISDATLIRTPNEALAGYGTVCGLFSSLLIDAFLAGRRVIVLRPEGMNRDLSPLSRRSLVPVARTPEMLAAALRAPFDAASSAGAAMRAAFAGSAVRLEALLLATAAERKERRHEH
jgi:hypothetical protein